ncbi:hypothetical protein GCM10009425_23390 [Pseudomonas asuensis]|uniref:Uncharacterized protein n=1 Tax=Pseudomonas asuensis TaxID=1825787 RepID=A0ABQ2GUR0_9PSED|nr:hypothetical protein GCM10009425_23390 [Pseudomonas asuensis]
MNGLPGLSSPRNPAQFIAQLNVQQVAHMSNGAHPKELSPLEQGSKCDDSNI